MKHILICGERGAGKSTLIRRLLAHNMRPLGGFITLRLKTADENGFYPIHLYPAAQSEREHRSTKENLVGICDSRTSVRHSEVFDTLGTRSINESPKESLILMDELGFLEDDSPAFQSAVLHALDGEKPVLAAVKTKDTAFLRAVREHENAEVFRIDEENREALYEALLPRILTWNEQC